MTKEEMIEKIKLEYDLFEVEDIYRLENVLVYIYDCRSAADSELRKLSVEKNVNKRDMVISAILGKLRERYGYLEAEDYTADNKLIDSQYAAVWNYRRCFDRLIAAVNDDNLQGVYRLAKFTKDKHKDTSLGMEYNRTLRRNGSVGEGFSRSVQPAVVDYVGFLDFFEDAFKDESRVDNPQFSKKQGDNYDKERKDRKD